MAKMDCIVLQLGEFTIDAGNGGSGFGWLQCGVVMVMRRCC